jgi:putative nucleotidyltransferase with HDIG domain
MIDILKEFNTELSYIHNKRIQNICKKLLFRYAICYYPMPSAKGPYHPPDEHGDDGFIRHCKKVAFWAVELCREHDFNHKIQDAMIMAALLHDIGRTDKILTTFTRASFTTNSHAVKSYQIIKTSLLNHKDVNHPIVKMALRMIHTHMHHWEKERGAPMPETLEEYIFATADYCASRVKVITPFLDPIEYACDVCIEYACDVCGFRSIIDTSTNKCSNCGKMFNI